MKIAIFDPYLDTLGGGERYMMAIARFFLRDHRVDVFWNKPEIKGEIQKRFGFNLDKLNFIENIFFDFY